jgi:hypothetical protein
MKKFLAGALFVLGCADVDSSFERIDEASSSTIIGANQMVNAACFAPQNLFKASRAVVNLTIPNATGSGYHGCTGWLANTDILVLAAHCISTQNQASGTLVDFCYENQTCTSQFLSSDYGSANNLTLLQSFAPPVDVAVLQLTTPYYGEHYGILDLDYSTNPALVQIAIPQHPNGNLKKIAQTEDGGQPCFIQNQNSISFTYRCDTDNGSSGAPILNQQNPFAVLGMHVKGFTTVNEAVKAGVIWNAIQQYLPAGNTCSGRCGRMAPSGCSCTGNGSNLCADKVAVCGKVQLERRLWTVTLQNLR